MTSTTGKPAAPLEGLRLRFRLLQFGLLAPVVVTAVLGLWYVKAVRARQAAVDAAAMEMLRRVADHTIDHASRIGDRAARTVLHPAIAPRPRTGEATLAAMEHAYDSLRRCRCSPVQASAYRFYWQPATGTFHATGTVSEANDPRRRLHTLGTNPEYVAGAVLARAGSDADGPWRLHLISVPAVNGPNALAGFDLDADSWWAGILRLAVPDSRREHFPMLPDPDTAFAAALVTDRSEVPLDERTYAGPSVDYPLPIGPSHRLRVTLNPSILPLTVQAAAAPRTALVLAGTLLASGLASLMALVLLRQVRRTMAQREAFVASISHELRTPLTDMLLHAETLHLDRDTPDAKARASGDIVREVRRLIRLVENSLTMAGAGRAAAPAIPTEPVDLTAVLRETLGHLEGALAQRKARLELSVEEGVTARIDAVAFDRIVTNLVENAMRYGPPGGAIRVSLHRNAQGVVLAVDDDGPGVPIVERDRIWRAFERGRAAEASSSTGIGLGLAIVKHLTDMHGGDAAVENGPGGGARFVVTLP